MQCPRGWLPILLLLLLVRVRVGLRLQQSCCPRCGGKGVQELLAWYCALYSGKVEDILASAVSASKQESLVEES